MIEPSPAAPSSPSTAPDAGFKAPLRVIVSLDVEEEGLFSGQYAATNCGVRNVALLPLLAPISDELGFPLTLFCAHTVFADAACRRVLEIMRDRHGAEIAAHLHHWSTPPLDEAPSAGGPPPRTDKMPRELLRRRLQTLLEEGARFNGAPLTSFRMGRWDLKKSVRPLLAEAGITLDSSVCPLRRFAGGADHFLAPADPYWVEGHGGTRLLEAPVTQIPLLRPLPRLWHGLSPQGSLDSFHFWGALSANPFWHGPRAMRWAVRLHHARGGRVLSLFWHSSEMLPGGSPHMPDERAARAFQERMFTFFRWLRDTFTVQGCTAAGLRAEADSLSFPSRPDGPGDW